MSHPRDSIRKHSLGWIVQCPTCGKKTKRMFRAEHPDALMNAERYWADHESSDEHKRASQSSDR